MTFERLAPAFETVTLSDPKLIHAAELEVGYLLSFDVERLLVEFQATAQLPVQAKQNYGGWENGPVAARNPDGRTNPVRFTGHFVGHYLAALAEALTGNVATSVQKQALQAKLDELVSGLGEAQAAYGRNHPDAEGFLPAFDHRFLPDGQDGLFVPFYNLHKLLQGLLDAIPFNEQALVIASAFGDFVARWVVDQAEVDFYKTEYGGLADALYQLFAITHSDRHLAAAHAFDELKLLAPLALGQDELAGLHANSTIPKITGALRRYAVFTGQPELMQKLSHEEQDELTTVYLAAAKHFWQLVVTHRTYVTGGNSQSEHFHLPDALWEPAVHHGVEDGGYNNNSTCETCNVHNMLKLTHLLFSLTGAAKYSEYSEHAMRNAILASQDPTTGMTTYFQPMMAGYSKVVGTLGTGFKQQQDIGEFWCCQGTGIENFAKLGDAIYFTNSSRVYVNRYFASSFADRAHNLRFTLMADLPKQARVTMQVAALDQSQPARACELMLRLPQWADPEKITMSVNDQVIAMSPVQARWISLPVHAGDTVMLTLPAHFQVVSAPDQPNWVAFLYGPTVLAQPLGVAPTKNFDYGGVMVRVAKFDAQAEHKARLHVDPATLTQLDTGIKRLDQPDDRAPLSFALSLADTEMKLSAYADLFGQYYAIYHTIDLHA